MLEDNQGATPDPLYTPACLTSVRTPARATWQVIFGIMLILASSMQGALGQSDPPADVCGTETVLRKELPPTSPALVPSASATAVIPSGADSLLLFAKPFNQQASHSFRVFLIEGSSGRMIAKAARVVAIKPVTKEVSAGGLSFAPSDSTAIQMRVEEETFPLWKRRNLAVVECVGGKVTGIGFVATRVSSWLAPWLCLPVVLLSYLLALYAVYASRKAAFDAPLSKKYPALFGTEVLTGRSFFNPIHLTANAYNQASVQKLQVLVFTFLVGSLLLVFVLRRGELTNISPTIAALLGISGIGAAVSQIAYIEKVRLSFPNWAWLEAKKVLAQKITSPEWKDLVLTNRQFDVYKLQTLVFSATVAIALVLDGGTNLGNFTIPEQLLGILGLSQVVYVGGILVRPPAANDLDKELDKLRAAADVYLTAVKQGTDIDAEGKWLPAPFPEADRAEVAKRARAQYEKHVETVTPMIESTLEIEVNEARLRQAPLLELKDVSGHEAATALELAMRQSLVAENSAAKELRAAA